MTATAPTTAPATPAAAPVATPAGRSGANPRRAPARCPITPAPEPALTIGIDFVRNMLSGLTARGLDCSAWLREAGIAPQLVEHDGARIAVRQFAALLRVLIERRDDEVLGLLSRPSRRGSFALQARAAIAAPTLDQAMRHVAHVFRLLHHDVSLQRVDESGLAGVALQFHDAQVAANPYLHEMLLRVYWRLFAWLVGGLLPVVRFDFAYARPAYSDGYGPIFPAPWRFNTERSAMWFQAEHLQLPVCRDEAALRVFVADGPVNVILPARDSGLAGRVRVYLQHTQPDWPDLEDTARTLSMSPSTLQHRLAAEGTSYRALKDQLRRDVAIFRLRTSEQPLVKLATALGFADAAAFQRAFKGWTGLAPGAYRRKPG